MSQRLLQLVEQSSMKEKVDSFGIGDTVDVHTKIQEGAKERIQVFSGTVIAKSGAGTREMFVVRRIVGGEGVERKFPVHSPRIDKIEVKRRSVVRRAKLYFLRGRTGTSVRLTDGHLSRWALAPVFMKASRSSLLLRNFLLRNLLFSYCFALFRLRLAICFYEFDVLRT